MVFGQILEQVLIFFITFYLPMKFISINKEISVTTTFIIGIIRIFIKYFNEMSKYVGL